MVSLRDSTSASCIACARSLSASSPMVLICSGAAFITASESIEACSAVITMVPRASFGTIWS